MFGRILLCMLCIFPIKVNDVLAQRASSRSYESQLAQKNQAFIRYARDFLDFAKSDEGQPSYDLYTVAIETSDSIDSARTLLQIYNTLSCPTDRDSVRAVIQTQFSFYAKETELGVKAANLEISEIKKPGIAAEATRMRDDLREVQDLFTSIKVQ